MFLFPTKLARIRRPLTLGAKTQRRPLSLLLYHPISMWESTKSLISCRFPKTLAPIRQIRPCTCKLVPST